MGRSEWNACDSFETTNEALCRVELNTEQQRLGGSSNQSGKVKRERHVSENMRGIRDISCSQMKFTYREEELKPRFWVGQEEAD